MDKTGLKRLSQSRLEMLKRLMRDVFGRCYVSEALLAYIGLIIYKKGIGAGTFPYWLYV